MNFDELKAQGGIVSTEPVPVQVTWKRGAIEGDEREEIVFEAYVVKQRFGTIEKLFKNGHASSNAELISSSVLIGPEKVKMTYEQVLDLSPSLAIAFIEAISSANGLQDKTPKA